MPLHDDLDNYDVTDLSDDPFRSPSPPRDAAPALGIDAEVTVAKRARPPAVRLDEDRLLSPAGIPRLRRRAARLRLRGRGHEFADAPRLLALYQLWLDDLYPRARFLDALAMVERAGHKRRIVAARAEWLAECRPRDEPAGDAEGEAEAEVRPQTPPRDVPDDNIYDATPRAPARDARPEDDLDSLIAEAEGRDGQQQPRPSDTEPDAEAEGRGQDRRGPEPPARAPGDGDFADEEAAMEELEELR